MLVGSAVYAVSAAAAAAATPLSNNSGVGEAPGVPAVEKSQNLELARCCVSAAAVVPDPVIMSSTTSALAAAPIVIEIAVSAVVIGLVKATASTPNLGMIHLLSLPDSCMNRKAFFGKGLSLTKS